MMRGWQANSAIHYSQAAPVTVPGDGARWYSDATLQVGTQVACRAASVSINPAMARRYHHNVYVILLDDAVLKHRAVARLNPKCDPSKPCVYVGMTGLPVEHRFENHKHGYKSAWTVKRYGICLLPELFEHLNPMPYDAAAQMEKDLTEELRSQGYTVTGGT